MRALIAFIKKEWLEQLRSGKLMILGLLFFLFGIMNPAIAKLTPWLLETMADTIAESGMIVGSVSVDAFTSWVQFFKNIPMALIAFILIESNIFTREYQTGTLVPVLTKGLQRYKVWVSKTLVLVVLWSVGYWMCYGVTYGYNAFYWDNSIVPNLAFSVVCWWLFGLWVIFFMVSFSVVAISAGGVLVATGGGILLGYLVGWLPVMKKYVPTMLVNSSALIYGMEKRQAYIPAILVTFLGILACFSFSVTVFNKKRM